MPKKAPKTLENLLTERETTHGRFTNTSLTCVKFEKVAEGGENWGSLLPEQRVALRMIFIKLARILSGNPDHLDHWRDIAGYATCVAETFKPQA